MITRFCFQIKRDSHRVLLLVLILLSALQGGFLSAAEAGPALRRRSPQEPMPDPIVPVQTRTFTLKNAKVEEVRLVLCGTLLAVPPHTFKFVVNEKENSFTLTDTRENLDKIQQAQHAFDRPSSQTDIQHRLMEMWIRIVNSFRA